MTTPAGARTAVRSTKIPMTPSPTPATSCAPATPSSTRASARWWSSSACCWPSSSSGCVLVRPAWKTLDDAPALRAQADAELLQMQAISNEARQLRALPPVPQSVAEQVLKSATDELGGKGKIAVQGDRARCRSPASTARTSASG